MTPEQFEQRMKDIEARHKGDIEAKHVLMDNLMTELLKELGYSAGVEVFENTVLWYA